MFCKMIGIYKILNLLNNHFYIGSSNDLHRRKNGHFNCLRNNKHHSKYLQNAFNLYNEKNFIFEIIEACSEDQLLIREQHYLDTLKPTYNISLKAGRIVLPKEIRDIISSKNRGKKMSLQSRKNISNGLKKAFRENLEYRENISKRMLGVKLSQETKDKLSLINKGKKHSKKTIEKMSNKVPWNKNKKASDQSIEKNRLSHIGKKTSQETKNKISKNSYFKNLKKVTCPHCGKNGNHGAMVVWHFDNCKTLKLAA